MHGVNEYSIPCIKFAYGNTEYNYNTNNFQMTTSIIMCDYLPCVLGTFCFSSSSVTFCVCMRKCVRKVTMYVRTYTIQQLEEFGIILKRRSIG